MYFDSPPIRGQMIVERFMRSVFNIRPNFPRYTKIWDVSIVLGYMEECSPGKILNSLKQAETSHIDCCYHGTTITKNTLVELRP